MGSGFAKKKKQAKLLQEQLSKMQDSLKNTEVVGSAPNDLVQITMNGDYEIRKVTIKPECVDKDDVEGLEDLIKAALQDAMNKIKDATPLGGGGNMGGFDLSNFSL